MTYPKLYKRDETNFGHNGEGILKDTTKCEVDEEDNGLFELTLECPVSSFLFDKLNKETIIKAWSSNELQEQLFRIYNIDDSINGIRVAKAQHISYDLLDNFIPSIEVVNISCEQALNEIFKHCAYPTRFKGFSDITHNGSIILQRVNPFEAIKGIRGSIVDTFGNGAKIIKDNFNIKVMNKRGSNNNVLIAHKKNLTGFNGNVDLTGVHTCIYPFAKVQNQVDGIEGPTTVEETINLPEKYIYSKYHQNFNHLKILPVDFSGEDVKDIESLRKKSETYFDNKSDIPRVNYKVSFISLFKTINYKDYKCL
ncbi:MAG: phage tail spike protein, partial [Paraclostridium sp.]